MATIKINRQIETIKVPDETGEIVYSWEVPTDDASIEVMGAKIASALDRFKSVSRQVENAQSDDEMQQATEVCVRLQKRVIVTIIGEEGYNDVLTYIGDGMPCDPANNLTNIGEVMAALLTWFAAHCTSQEMRRATTQLSAMRITPVAR